MRLSRLFGILSIVFLLIAMLTVILPIYSVATGLRVKPVQSSPGIAPNSFLLSNKGFLPVDGISLDVVALAPNGTQLYSILRGPLNVPPGGTALLNITTSNLTFSNATGTAFANLSSITLKITADADLGGLIPVSATAEVTVSLGNSTRSSA